MESNQHSANGWNSKPRRVIIVFAVLNFLVFTAGTFYEVLVTMDMCFHYLVSFFLPLTVVTPILIVKRFGTGIAVYVPYATLGFFMEYYMEWVLDPALVAPWAAVAWSVLGLCVGLSADLAFRYLPSSLSMKRRALLMGLAVGIVDFLTTLAALAFLYVVPGPGVSHFLNAVYFTLPWLLVNSAFGGYTAHAISSEL